MAYFLYILSSQSAKKYYIGSSAQPEIRVQFHNTLEKGFTARYRPWKLIFTEEFGSKALSQQAERKIKSWKSRIMIEKLIRCEVFY